MATTALQGGDGADTLVGNAGVDTLHGGAGDDRLFGGLGNDLVYGDAGHDTLDGEEGEDRLEGGTGYDFLYGRTGNDFLYGQDGDDVLHGNEGDDYLEGGLENDDLNGELGNDLLVQTADVDQSLTNTTLTGLGNDRYATVERIQLIGGAGANRFDLSGYTGAALVDGREGIDTILSTADADHRLSDWNLRRSDGMSVSLVVRRAGGTGGRAAGQHVRGERLDRLAAH